MKYNKRLLELAAAFNQTLPSDKYSSVDEWFLRHTERMKDLGYTPDDTKDFIAETRKAIALRDEARATLVDTVARKCRLTDASDALKQDARQFVMQHLGNMGQFIGLHPKRDLSRYARHIAYWSRKSSRIKAAYTNLFDTIRRTSTVVEADEAAPTATPVVRAGNASSYVNTILQAAPPEQTNTFAMLFAYRYWNAEPGDAYAFYPSSTFLTCPYTSLPMPSSRAISVVFEEAGRSKRAHPTFAMSAAVIRDPITGTYVLKEAVEWVTLADTNALVWRRPNEASGNIYIDEEDGLWHRGDTHGRVAGYHSAPREWRQSSTPGVYARHIGVELECGFKTSGNLSRFLSRFVESNGRFVDNRPFLIENDGSLDSVPNGVEIVSEPLQLLEGYQAEDSHWRWLLDKLVRSGGEGWKHRQYAGIHVNMDVSDRTPSEILRYVVFVHNAAAISKFVSGRKVIYGAEGDESTGRSVPSDKDLATLDGYLKTSKKHYGGGYEMIDSSRFRAIAGSSEFNRDSLARFRSRGKYQPVHIRSGMQVLETRIFGSNIRYEGFMACVEFCVGGMDFTSGLSNDLDVLHPDIGTTFRSWLSDNRSKYPNLAARIGVIATSTASTVAARPLAELTA